MATITEMKSILNDMSESSVNIPGLTTEEIAPIIVETKYKNFDVDTKKSIEDNLKGKGRDFIDGHIITIKSSYEGIISGNENIIKTVPMVITSMVMPSSTVPPNPAFGVIEASQKKTILMTLLNTIKNLCISLLQSAVAICFTIPDIIMTAIKTVLTLKDLIKTIPAP